jgi:ADP-ribose pyrophosphatase YjhB (NUDIX family)
LPDNIHFCTIPMSSSTFPAYPVSAVISVLFRNDHVLLVSRKNPPDVGMWGFPGGKIEFGESIADAAVRELREETGVQADFKGVVTVVDDIVIDGAAPYHFMLIAALCTWQAGEPVAADDAEEARWVRIADIANGELHLSANVAEVAQQALQMAQR